MSVLLKFVKDAPGIKSIRRARYARFFRNSNNLNLFSGIFNDFITAQANAPKNKVLGYDHEEPAAMYNEYFKNIGPSDFPALFWLEKLRDKVNSIYDFGGHVGIKYYAYTQFLSESETLKWTTYDLPAVVTRGRQIAQKRKAEHLNFSDDTADLSSGYDLLFVSGSFQYLENPIDLLFSNLRQKPKYILINMLPVRYCQMLWMSKFRQRSSTHL